MPTAHQLQQPKKCSKRPQAGVWSTSSAVGVDALLALLECLLVSSCQSPRHGGRPRGGGRTYP